MEAGCDDYDTKPVDLPRLLSKMAAFGVEPPECPRNKPASCATSCAHR